MDRLRAIISYDRICVLEAGQIAVSLPFDLVHKIRNSRLFQKFDTHANLFTIFDGFFRCMCERSAITLDDIKLAGKAKERPSEHLENNNNVLQMLIKLQFCILYLR